MDAIAGSIGVAGFLFIVLLLILWTLLPFAVFGIKDRLDTQTKLLQDIKNELKRINAGEKTGSGTLAVKAEPSTAQATPNPEQEIEVSIKDLYADPAEKWFKRDKD